jgi:hypothetical protein
VYTYSTPSKEAAMQDQPEPTREEEDQVPQRQEEHEAMRGAGHDEPPDVAQSDEEIHDA